MRDLAIFVTWIAGITVFYSAIYFGVPLIIRSWFRLQMDRLRDECMDAIIDGELPDVEATCDYVRTVDRFERHAERITLDRVLAMYVSARRMGISLDDDGPSYAELKPAGRAQMHDLDRRAIHALAVYLVFGSPRGWQLGWVILIDRYRRRRSKQPPRPHANISQPTKEQLARAAVIGVRRQPQHRRLQTT